MPLKVIEVEDLETLMGLERELAQIAFCQAANIPESESGVVFSNRGEIMRLLFEDYERLHVTAGKQESKQWIQSIEAQARSQAKPFSPRARG